MLSCQIFRSPHDYVNSVTCPSLLVSVLSKLGNERKAHAKVACSSSMLFLTGRRVALSTVPSDCKTDHCSQATMHPDSVLHLEETRYCPPMHFIYINKMRAIYARAYQTKIRFASSIKQQPRVCDSRRRKTDMQIEQLNQVSVSLLQINSSTR